MGSRIMTPAARAAQEKKDALRWVAKRIGSTYCAPACGHGCTWDEFQQATERAKALCARLGDGWKPRVWENGGWNYSACKGVAQMHAHHYTDSPAPPSYSIYINSHTIVHGNHGTVTQFIADSRDPVKALKKALSDGRKHLRSVTRDLEALS